MAVAGLLLLADVAAHPAHVAVGQRRQSNGTRQDARAIHRRACRRGHGLQRRRIGRHPVRGLLRARRRVGIERQRRAARLLEFRQRLFIALAEAVPAERLDRELQTIARGMLVIAEPVEDAHHRLGHVEHLFDRHEVVEHVAGHRQNRRAARDGDAEPALAVLDARPPPDVVDRGERVILAASLECNLELPRQLRRERMPQEVARQRFGVRRHVEDLGLGGPGIRTAGDVAHRVAARLARGQPFIAQLAHHLFDDAELHEVVLDVLACGDVTEATGVACRDAGQRSHLR